MVSKHEPFTGPPLSSYTMRGEAPAPLRGEWKIDNGKWKMFFPRGKIRVLKTALSVIINFPFPVSPFPFPRRGERV
jgi:hypothetical protein